MAEPTNITLIEARSHGVDYQAQHRGIGAEAVYFSFTGEWRGETVEFEMEANRYVHSEGWSEWRIFRYIGFGDTLTETAGARLRDGATPMVEEWLASDSYKASRAVAFAYELRRLMRDERYDTHTSAEALAKYANELSDDDRTALAGALFHLGKFLNIIDNVPRGSA